MPLSESWSNENTIYNQNKTSGEATFIDVEICIDIKNADIRPSYITKKILKGTEYDFLKNLGTKAKAKEASFFAYIIINNKPKMYYYSSINIIKKGSLVWYNSDRYIVKAIDSNNYLVCRNRKNEIFTILQNHVKVIRY